MSREQVDRRFSRFTEHMLRNAGWYPGRVIEEAQLEPWYAFRWVSEPGYCYASAAALRVLREFGGLCIQQGGPGKTCLREPFFIDPLKTTDLEDDNWLYNEWDAGETLYPLGCIGEDAERVLAITPRGRVFEFGYAPLLIGTTFDEALENMIIGLSPTKVLAGSEGNAADAGRVVAAIRKLFGSQ